MTKPIIGISSNTMSDFDGWFTRHIITYVKSEAIDAVIKAGGEPLIIPVTANQELIDNYLAKIDGLIITGGHDVYPLLYADHIDENSGAVFPETDYFDIGLVRKALTQKIPTIVICRGIQISNVAFGGTLYQDLFSEIKTNIKHNAPKEGNINVHGIDILEEDALFTKLTGLKGRIYVNSIHHQGIKDLADIFKVIARSDDGVIEIIELKDQSQFFVGMQFHPEILASYGNQPMLKLFKGMVAYIENGEKEND